MIKSVILATIATMASAEADAQYLLGSHIGALPYAHHASLGFASAHAVAHLPVVKSVVEAPAEISHEVTQHTVPVALGYHGLGYGYGGYGGHIGYGKREADAAVLDGHTRVISAPTPLIHNPPVIHHGFPTLPVAHAAYGYGLPGLGYGYGLGLPHGIVKRDAAVLDGHTRVITAPTPLIHNPPVIHHAVLPVPAFVHPAAYGHGLHGLGYGYGHGLGHAIVKREADAQYLLGSHIGALPYAHHAPLGFASAHAVAHLPVVKSVVETPAEVSHEVTQHTVPVALGYHGLGYGHGFGGFAYGR